MTDSEKDHLFERINQIDEKQDTILICLTGKPLATPPVPGLVQISQDHGAAIKAQTEALAKQDERVGTLEKWSTKVKMRFAALSGGVIVVGFLFNRAWEWVIALFGAKHD